MHLRPIFPSETRDPKASIRRFGRFAGCARCWLHHWQRIARAEWCPCDSDAGGVGVSGFVANSGGNLTPAYWAHAEDIEL